MPLCDRCQQEINGVRLPADVPRLRPTHHKIFAILWSRRPAFVKMDAIYSILYGERLNPPYPEVLRAHMCIMRRALKNSRYRVDTEWGRGYRVRA